MQNIYRGFLFFGETGFQGRHWIRGYNRQTFKTLFRIGGRSYGIIALTPGNDWQYKESVLNQISEKYPVRIKCFDDRWDWVETIEWSGKYPVREPKMTYLITVQTKNYEGIGTVEMALALIKDGIVPEPMTPDDDICSIGWCQREQKWYGWSHRARFGFGIGDRVKEGDCVASSGWTEEALLANPTKDKSLPVGFVAANLDDCKRMAIAFADSVG
jgi:hypothetical protein